MCADTKINLDSLLYRYCLQNESFSANAFLNNTDTYQLVYLRCLNWVFPIFLLKCQMCYKRMAKNEGPDQTASDVQADPGVSLLSYMFNIPFRITRFRSFLQAQT